EFVLAYQPIVQRRRGVTGAEALLRWKSAERGLVLPDMFLPYAEEANLLPEIGRWVIRGACRQLRQWRDKGLELGRVSVNLSFRELVSPGFPAVVEAAMAECKLPPGSIEIEMTETSVMREAEQTVRILTELRAHGVLVCVDDFGTGYSSLSYLTQLPVDRLKIDRSFVHRLPGKSDAEAVVDAIAALAKALELSVVAEGVETAEQAAFLHAHGIGEMQGFHFSRPMTPDALVEWMRVANNKHGSD